MTAAAAAAAAAVGSDIGTPGVAKGVAVDDVCERLSADVVFTDKLGGAAGGGRSLLVPCGTAGKYGVADNKDDAGVPLSGLSACGGVLCEAPELLRLFCWLDGIELVGDTDCDGG